MKKIKKMLFCFLLPYSLSAQPIPYSDHYVLNPFLINPAFAGEKNTLNIGSSYRRQFVDIFDSPETITIYADAPSFSKKAGLGLIAGHNRIDKARDLQLVFNYASKVRMGNGILSFGIGSGIRGSNTDWVKLVSHYHTDENSPNDSRTFWLPHISLGFYYVKNKYFAGFSVPGLLGYKYNINENKAKSIFDPSLNNYMLNTGYLLNITENIEFKPSILVSYSEKGGLLYDLNVFFNFYDRFWLGASYRDNQSAIGLFQINLSTQLRFAYSFNTDPAEYKWYKNGVHEIMLKYVFSYKIDVINPLNY